MSATGSFHHLGVACRSLGRESRAYAALGYAPESVEFDDPVHGIRCVFLAGPGPRLELVADRPGSEVVEPWLRSGSRVYHIAFEVDQLDSAIDTQLRANAKLLAAPAPAVAFGGRHVAFVMVRNGMVVEFVSRR